MHENEYAKVDSAHILTGQEAAEWYNKQFETDYAILDNGGASSTFYSKTFTTSEPISVLENGSYYWFESPYDSSNVYSCGAASRLVGCAMKGYAYGVRILVSLKPNVQLKEGTPTEGITTWDIVEN